MFSMMHDTYKIDKALANHRPIIYNIKVKES